MHTTVIGSKTYRKFTEIKWELLKTSMLSGMSVEVWSLGVVFST